MSIDTPSTASLHTWLAESLPDAVFLCGAGISYAAPTSLPTVNSFLRQLLVSCESPQALIETVVGRSWRSPVPRFEGLVEEVGKKGDSVAQLARVFSSSSFNSLHSAIAAFIRSGASVITTNFDNCIEEALLPDRVRRVVYLGEDLDPGEPTTSVICKPHGSHPFHEGDQRSQLVISISAISRTNQGFTLLPHWRQYLLSLIRNRLLVVVGYSGSDDFDLTPLILQSKPRAVLWIDHAEHLEVIERVPESLESVAKFASLPVRAINCRTDMFLARATRAAGLEPSEGPISTPYRVQDYVLSHFPKEEERTALSCMVLLYYGLNEEAISISDKGEPLVMLQHVKALFRLGMHKIALALVDEIDSDLLNTRLQFELLYVTSAALSYMGKVTDAVRRAEEAVVLASYLEPVATMTALNQLGGALIQAEQLDKAEAAFLEAQGLQKRVPHLRAEATTSWGLGCIQGMRNDFKSSLGSFLSAKKIFLSLGDDLSLGHTAYNCADALVRLGRISESQKHLEEAETIFRRIRSPHGILYVLWIQARIRFGRDEFGEALGLLEQARELVSQQAGFLYLLEFGLLFNCILYRLRRPLETFRHDTFSEILQRRDQENGGWLAKLMEGVGPMEFEMIERWLRERI